MNDTPCTDCRCTSEDVKRAGGCPMRVPRRAMTDYARFDAALLAAIESGVHSQQQLAHDLRELAEPLCVAAKPFYSPSPVFRVVDRRLQALRRARKILYGAGGWKLFPRRAA